MLVRFERYFVYFYAVCFLLSLLVVLAIINGRSNPGYKIAWLIPILLFPIFGGLFYLMFGQNHLSRRERKKMAPLREEVHQLLPAENPVLRQLERESPEAANQARYIEKRAYAPLTKDLSLIHIYLQVSRQGMGQRGRFGKRQLRLPDGGRR